MYRGQLAHEESLAFRSLPTGMGAAEGWDIELMGMGNDVYMKSSWVLKGLEPL